MPSTTPLLIDCDTGIDDALALLYAVASADAEIVGVGCVAGNAELDDVVRNTLAVLELAGRPDIEVAAGRATPIERALRIADDTHGPTGLGYAALQEPGRTQGGRDAADLIVDSARERPGEITLVTLGPLSNIAVALQREPELPRLLKRLYMMVGAFGVPGNTTPVMEWNAGVDPEALAVTIKGWAAVPDATRPIGMGLDVTEGARVEGPFVDELAAVAGDPGAPVVVAVRDALRFYFEFHEEFDGFYGAFIHDALVVAAVLDPALIETQPLAVEIETEGRWTTGQTVADWRGSWDRDPDLDVAISADIETFLRRYVKRVGLLATRS